MTYDINNQYESSIKKGDTVSDGKNSYRVQNDGRGWLHVIKFDNGVRRKVPVSELIFPYGSEADFIFNKWWLVYPSYTIFKQYAEAEIAWAQTPSL